MGNNPNNNNRKNNFLAVFKQIPAASAILRLG
jgi:hypothetical protein